MAIQKLFLILRSNLLLIQTYMFNITKPIAVAATILIGASGFAQDNLVNSLKINASEKSKNLSNSLTLSM